MVRQEISVLLNSKYLVEKTQGGQQNKKVKGVRDEIEILLTQRYGYAHTEPAKTSSKVQIKDEISQLVKKYYN